MTLVYGVDSSFDPLTPGEAGRLFDAGVRAFIQALWTGAQAPSVRVANLTNARDAGLITAGYAAVSPGRSGAAHMDEARRGIPDDLWNSLAKVAVDVELPGLNYETHVMAAWNRVAELGKAMDCYTSYHFWVEVLRFPDRLPGVGLWNAFWDGNPDIDFPSLPFGGWQPHEVWGEQWSGDTLVEGQFVDRNTFVLEALQPEEAEVGDMRIMGHPADARAFLLVGPKAYHIPDPATWEDLRLLIYGADPNHGPQPHQVTESTYEWLKSNSIFIGLP
jgi:hypothetical protein